MKKMFPFVMVLAVLFVCSVSGKTMNGIFEYQKSGNPYYVDEIEFSGDLIYFGTQENNIGYSKYKCHGKRIVANNPFGGDLIFEIIDNNTLKSDTPMFKGIYERKK